MLSMWKGLFQNVCLFHDTGDQNYFVDLTYLAHWETLLLSPHHRRFHFILLRCGTMGGATLDRSILYQIILANANSSQCYGLGLPPPLSSAKLLSSEIHKHPRILARYVGRFWKEQTKFR